MGKPHQVSGAGERLLRRVCREFRPKSVFFPMALKILVTGGAGYIGSVLVRQLLRAGHAVRVLDRLTFGGESLRLLSGMPGFSLQVADLREEGVAKAAVKGADAVVHLAAIVGDPACRKFSQEATDIMDTASCNLYRAAVAAGITQFIFASTCSNYGVMQGQTALLTEDTELNPQSHYADLKVKFEKFLLAQQDQMATTILRFATVYGVSPRMRFDLIVNHFSRDLGLGKQITVFGKEGWRPYCHVTDLAGSILLSLRKPAAPGERRVFNVGDSEENYTKEMIVKVIQRRVNNGEVIYVESDDPDPRNYKVDFSKIAKQLGFRISLRVPDGVEEVLHLVKAGAMEDPYDPIYINA
jgi:nucleoside-diphosphate-sugar epimerase